MLCSHFFRRIGISTVVFLVWWKLNKIKMKDVVEIFYVLSIIFTSSIPFLYTEKDKFNEKQSYSQIILQCGVIQE